MFNPVRDAALILCENSAGGIGDLRKFMVMLENGGTPVNTQYMEKLYNSVLSKAHIDFDDIPNSKGNIRNYSGYSNMIDVLMNIEALAQEQKASSVVGYCNTVKTAIKTIETLEEEFSIAFKLGNEQIMLDYNIYTYACVQATTSLLYEFVEYVKRPDKETMDIVLKNSVTRPNLFYITQLDKFINIATKMEYRKYARTVINNGKENFIGTETMVGITAVAVVAMAIIPVTREIVYRGYSAKAKLSEYTAQQAYFLEINRASVQSNSALSANQKKQILAKQDRIKNMLLSLSNKLKVSHHMSEDTAKKLIEKDNKLLTLDRIQHEVDSKPLSLL